MQKISLFHLLIFKSILGSYHQTDHTHFLSCPHQKVLSPCPLPFNLYDFVPACKKLGNFLCLFLRYTVNLNSRDQTGHIHFLTMLNQNLFEQLSAFLNFYQHEKNEAVSLICSGEINDIKILQSDWLRAFWPTSLIKNLTDINQCLTSPANNV